MFPHWQGFTPWPRFQLTDYQCALPLVLVCSQGYCLLGYHHICHPHCIRTCRCSKKKINRDECYYYFFFVGSSDSIKKEIGFDFSLRNPRLWTSENQLDFKRQIECALTSLLDLRISKLPLIHTPIRKQIRLQSMELWALTTTTTIVWVIEL